jgi:TPP-dependent 2-oxoacid decarboxylase
MANSWSSGSGSDPITAAALYPRLEALLREDDILVAETGTISMGLGFARMPAGASSTTRPCRAPSVGKHRQRSVRHSPLANGERSS